MWHTKILFSHWKTVYLLESYRYNGTKAAQNQLIVPEIWFYILKIKRFDWGTTHAPFSFIHSFTFSKFLQLLFRVITGVDYVVGGLVCNVKANCTNNLSSLQQDSNQPCNSANCLSYPSYTVLDVFIKAFTLLVSKMIVERLEPTVLRTPCKCSNHLSCEIGHVVHSNSERHLILIPSDMWTLGVTSCFF